MTERDVTKDACLAVAILCAALIVILRWAGC